MLVSTTLLTKAAQNAQKSYKTYTENYKAGSAESSEDPKVAKELPFSVMAILFALALIIFIFELIVLFHAVKIAIKCSKPGSQRICHIVLAVFFTYPYLLLALFLSECAQSV
jgi:hypothetical protein